MERWLSYDQISLIPTQVSTLEHRAEADTSVQFGPIKLSVPIVAAPMKDVSNGAMSQKLAELGSFGWIHRFQSIDEMQAEIYPESYPPLEKGPRTFGVALPANANEASLMAGRFYHANEVRIFCIDTANGANQMVEKTIKRLKDSYPDIFIVAGNVASHEAFQALEGWGADAIRVGIAGGSVCETRTETGVYSPMASAVHAISHHGAYNDCWPGEWMSETFERKALLIADGGIKNPADVCKALALGANLVMVGGVFGGTKEAPGEVLKIDGKLYKVLRGAASYSVQKGNSGYNEGAETIVDYQGSVEKVINRFAAGLRSSMSYMNARNLEEYRKNVKVVEI